MTIEELTRLNRAIGILACVADQIGGLQKKTIENSLIFLSELSDKYSASCLDDAGRTPKPPKSGSNAVPAYKGGYQPKPAKQLSPLNYVCTKKRCKYKDEKGFCKKAENMPKDSGLLKFCEYGEVICGEYVDWGCTSECK